MRECVCVWYMYTQLAVDKYNRTSAAFSIKGFPFSLACVLRLAAIFDNVQYEAGTVLSTSVYYMNAHVVRINKWVKIERTKIDEMIEFCFLPFLRAFYRA